MSSPKVKKGSLNVLSDELGPNVELLKTVLESTQANSGRVK